MAYVCSTDDTLRFQHLVEEARWHGPLSDLRLVATDEGDDAVRVSVRRPHQDRELMGDVFPLTTYACEGGAGLVEAIRRSGLLPKDLSIEVAQTVH